MNKRIKGAGQGKLPGFYACREKDRKSSMGKKKQKILAVLLVCIGVTCMLYPWFSNWLYSNSIDSKVEVYEKQTENTDQAELEDILQKAELYNQKLAQSRVALTDPFELVDAGGKNDISYESTLDLDGSGLMCFVEIPKVDVYLPVYHGTSAEVLGKGAGHLEGSALPVGGIGNRPVISAHTGVNASKMFSDLTELEKGDLFFIHVLDEVLAYRVCEIQVILPEDTNSLVAENGRDLVSLLTCTPYGVNTHRLVVTGERTEYSEPVLAEAKEERKDTGESQWMQAYKKALLISAVSILAVSGFVKGYHVARRKRKSR